ncbi:hypothetical protein ACFQX4_10145 [Roseomonas sp. GCM10028921]
MIAVAAATAESGLEPDGRVPHHLMLLAQPFAAGQGTAPLADAAPDVVPFLPAMSHGPAPGGTGGGTEPVMARRAEPVPEGG